MNGTESCIVSEFNMTCPKHILLGIISRRTYFGRLLANVGFAGCWPLVEKDIMVAHLWKVEGDKCSELV